MKLLGSNENKITKEKNGGNVFHLETTKVILVHINIAKNDYHQESRVLHTFFPNMEMICQLLDISPNNFLFLKTFNSEFSYIEVQFIDQNSKPLEIEDKTNITLVIN